MIELITALEFAAFRNISTKVDSKKITEAIQQAQQSDLVKILGDFYFDVLKNKDESTYADLMNGSTFTYCEEEFIHVGIKKLLADYVHSRYVYFRNVKDTPFGMVSKEYQDGAPVDRNLLKDLAKQDQIDAGNKFIFIQKYLLSDTELFSRYCNTQKEVTSFASPKYSIL